MYMLQRANIKNAVANIVVAILFSNSGSAVKIIVNRLVSCIVSSCLAFIVGVSLLVEFPVYYVVSVALCD